MRQRIRVIFRVFAFTAAIAVAWLWTRSGDSYDDAHYTMFSANRSRLATIDFASIEGHVFMSLLRFHDNKVPTEREPGTSLNVSSATGNKRLWSWPLATFNDFYEHGHIWLRFGVVTAQDLRSAEGTESIWGVGAPHASVAAVLSVPALIWGISLLRQSRRRGAGRCISCGYDLRASPHSCPECGTKVIG